MFVEKEIKELEKIKPLLDLVGLKIPKNIDYTVGVYDGQRLIGTGSLVRDTLQGIAIDPEFQGEGISTKVITYLMKKALEMGKEQLYIFTKPEEIYHFEALGFKTVAKVKSFAALLEWGRNGIEQYKAFLATTAASNPKEAACIVVNCNPFTLGHRYLIEKASKENKWLYVLVVEEDVSLFPFEVRLDLVKRGTSDLSNVTVIPGGKYVISHLTFPSYFIRDEDVITAQVSLDLEIFARHIAPILKVKKRYVGQEPYCPVTAAYNHHMKQILTGKGLEVIEVERLKKDAEAVSASKVRQLIREDRIEELEKMVPLSTYQYLISPQAKEVIEKIKHTKSRH
ncbi:[citrate (pro-3S)-lyase] ligase [Petroclostridium sp. X23]|uniref:[citrate (pro-3S)-lyase] ligase n=1 Tax=Petroclostridium sp. X23 TaxID=3045146 RepID=UPI0024AC8F65|nr:[citrate (pro-3S)-lyase] ligase [Petroclostridium sp. X23]WHH57839.1 [citrate (pro-3S)-lyase] ligase [Petroclostridium sp. X23]